MASVIDWTVDKLLSGLATLNARAESAQNTIRANRAAYLESLRALPTVPDALAREVIRAELGRWIPRQVDTENRFNAFAASYAQAKATAKRFLQSVNVTPPAYLGQVQLAAVPAAVYGGIAIGLAVIATIVTLAQGQSKSIGVISDTIKLARDRGWTAQETAQAVKAASDAASAAAPDPLGISGMLKAALPVLVIGAAIYFLGPMMRRRAAA